MQFEVPDLVADLRALRRGYGVEAAELKIGNALGTVCGVLESDGPHARRQKVTGALTALVGKLPEDLRFIAEQTFGLNGAADVRYEKRLARVEERIDRNVRTVKRRVDETLRRVAELALDGERPDRGSSPWHTAQLRVRLVFGPEAVEVFEVRRIVSHQPGLAEVAHSVTVDPFPGQAAAPQPGELGIDLIDGGTLAEPNMLAANRIGYRLRLPRPLDPGEEHEFSYRITMAGAFAPRYVCTPKYPCDNFKLTVRFGPRRIPERIWRLREEMPLALNDLQPRRDELQANAAGEVTAEFSGLVPNLSYGIGWSTGNE